VAAILDQLEGFEAPAGSWESEILPARVSDYDPAWLDALCLSGKLTWLRLSPPRLSPEKTSSSAPVRSTPIVLLNRKHIQTWNRAYPAHRIERFPTQHQYHNRLRLLERAWCILLQ
jgi:ATP-dependent Lhr-like helicase